MQYLVGGRFKVKTDQNSLKYFLEQKELNERHQKCVSKIQAYDLEIEYIKGKSNVVPDALSRRPATLSLMSSSSDSRSHILVEFSKDKFSCELLDG